MASETEPRLRWLLLDLNSYFTSVEQELRPELRGRPIALVPVMANTTCAIAASHEAKAFGVRTGTQVGDAKKMYLSDHCFDSVIPFMHSDVDRKSSTRRRGCATFRHMIDGSAKTDNSIVPFIIIAA